MKKTVFLSIAAFIALTSACNSSKNESGADAYSFDTTKLSQGDEFYQCPMHPEVLSDQPGNCPKCGMALERTLKN